MKGMNRPVPSKSSLARKPDIFCFSAVEVDVWCLMQKSTITAVTAPMGRLIQKHQRHVVRSVKTPVRDHVSSCSISRLEAK